MTFLNLALLGGTAAGTIPLLIHLLHRRRVKPLPWAAMHLLRQHPALQRRNPQLEHLLLLLLRVAIPVLLALAMAWPVLTANRPLTGSAPSSTLVLLDHSPSMAALSGGLSSLERAKSEAARILQNLPRGSEFALLPLDASEALLPPSVNTRPALHLLQAHQPSPHAARPTEALEAAAALLPQMHHPHKQVVLLSDFQKSNWPPHQAALRTRALKKLLALPAPPKITLFQVGAGTAPNLAIESLEFPKAPVGPGQPVRFVANLRNYSPQPASEIRVAWKVDGETRSETRLSIAPQSSAQTAFTHAFPSAGSHWVEVFTDADSLTLDNSLLASVPVQERVRVLLVSGRPSSEPLQGETDFLEVALNPGSDAHSLLTPAVVDIPSFLPKALQKTAVVVLANVRSLGPQQLRDLEEFVRQGGGLLVFPGNRLDAQWYNQHLHRQGEGLMPFALHALRSDSAFPHPPGIRLLRPEHPAFAPLQDAGFSLSGAAIRQWFSLQAPEPSRAAPEILATLENGDPFLVESAFGSGTVLTCASACNSEWSNLPARPAFLPLMQRLVLHLSSHMLPPRNLAPGEPLSLRFPSPPANSPAKENFASVLAPDGTPSKIPLSRKDDRLQGQFPETTLPGLYLVTGPSGETQHFAVNAPRTESDPELLSSPQLQALANELQAERVESGDQFQQAALRSRNGIELWRWLLLGVLLCAFGELLIQNRFRPSKEGKEGRR